MSHHKQLKKVRGRIDRIAREMRDEARQLYTGPRDHYIRSRQPLSQGLLGKVWGIDQSTVSKQMARDREKGHDWDEARQKYLSGLAAEAHMLIKKKVASDEQARQTLYRQHLMMLFTLAQKMRNQLIAKFDAGEIDTGQESTAVLNMQRLQRMCSEAWVFEERIFGIAALKDAERRHMEDLRSMREAIVRNVSDPDTLARIRRDVDALIAERARETSDRVADALDLLSDDEKISNELQKQLDSLDGTERAIANMKARNASIRASQKAWRAAAEQQAADDADDDAE